MTPSLVFITARFRSGSTMLWNIFRQVPNVTAYYEPLHERLPQWIVSRIPPQTCHDHVDTYFREYPPVEELAHYHRPEFGVCRLHLEADEAYPELASYLRYLIDYAPAGQVPVFQFNRVDFRLPWLKTNFPGIPIIHLYRSPRDQWCSSIATYPGVIDDDLDADPYLITTWARDLCQQFPFLASPHIRHAYQRHYYLWKLSYLAGTRLADLSISYEAILKNPEPTIRRIFQAAGLHVETHIEQCLSILVRKPIPIWQNYRSEEWFTALEQDCETILGLAGFNQYIENTPLSETATIHTTHKSFQTDQKIYTWALRNSQLTILKKEQELQIKEQVVQEKEQNLHEKERDLQQIHALTEERLQIIYHLQSHPLRIFLKRYLPKFFVNRIRQKQSWFQPKLGQLFQYLPISCNIPEHYSRSQITPHQSSPTISIITPSLNQGQFLERTLRSVLEQQYPALEYIVQDGGSSDETPRILEKYRSHVTHVESSRDGGQAHALNRGFQRATGEILAWLNSDDVLLPGTLAYVGRFFQTHPEVDVVYGHRIVMNEDDQEIGRWILPPHDARMLRWADYVPQETVFWRRRIWEKTGGSLDESFHFALDWELLLRFCEAGATFRRLPRFLAAFRVHAGQKTSQHLDSLGLQEMARLRRQMHGREVSNQEALAQLRVYMFKHLMYHWLYRWKLLRF